MPAPGPGFPARPEVSCTQPGAQPQSRGQLRDVCGLCTAHLPEGGDNKDQQIDLGSGERKRNGQQGAGMQWLRPGRSARLGCCLRILSPTPDARSLKPLSSRRLGGGGGFPREDVSMGVKSVGPQAAAVLWDLVERSQHLKAWTQLTFSVPFPVWTQGRLWFLSISTSPVDFWP